MSEEKILIPAKFYIGFNERSRYEDAGDTYDWRIPLSERGDKISYRLGFATYFEDSARFKKRKSTVDGWASPTTVIYVHNDTAEKVTSKDKRYHAIRRAVNWDRDDKEFNGDDWEEQTIAIDHLQPRIIDNAPVNGFRIPHEVSRDSRWHRNTVWRMVDPRGWELEITSGNMASIMEHVGIGQGGIIEGECVWAWSMSAGGKLILLPVTSPQYLAGIKHTTRVAKKVSLRDVQLGDEVELANGTTGIWLGTYNLLTQDDDSRYSSSADHSWDGKIRRSFLGLENGKYFMLGSPKVSSITKTIKTPLDQDDILKELNIAVRERGTDPFESSDHSYTPNFIFVYRGSIKPGDYKLKLRIVSEGIKKTAFAGKLKAQSGFHYPVWFIKQEGSWFACHISVIGTHGHSSRYGYGYGTRDKDFFAQPNLGKAGFAELDYGIWDPQNLKVGYDQHWWGGHQRGGYHYGGNSLGEVIAKSKIPANHGANPFNNPRAGHSSHLIWNQIDDDIKCSICKEFAKTTAHFVSDVEDLEWKEPVIEYDGEEYPIHL